MSIDAQSDSFQLYDLRIELVCPDGERILCGAKKGDYFSLHGEMLHLPPNQGISIYSIGKVPCGFPGRALFSHAMVIQNADQDCQAAAAVLPLLAAKQRATHPNDWMSTDALVACPDPNCKSLLKIVRTGLREFSHAETTAVSLDGDHRNQ